MSDLKRSNAYHETLIEVNFVAFGQERHRVEYYKDCTIEQACNLIWKICPTAVILYAWQYGITDALQLKGFKKKLTDEELENFYKKM